MVTGGGSRRKPVVLVAVSATAVAVVAGVVWFQPQKLLINQQVDEPPPAADGSRPAAATPGSGPVGSRGPAGSTRPATIAAGRFRSLGHPTSGRALALQLPDGRRFLRLAALHTSNGPDLFVYLSTARADGPRDRFDDDFVALGRLKGNRGNQNYQIPTGVDLGRYPTVVIWCRRFSYAFGAAPLAPAPR
jgi:hypothetical protein